MTRPSAHALILRDQADAAPIRPLPPRRREPVPDRYRILTMDPVVAEQRAMELVGLAMLAGCAFGTWDEQRCQTPRIKGSMFKGILLGGVLTTWIFMSAKYGGWW